MSLHELHAFLDTLPDCLTSVVAATKLHQDSGVVKAVDGWYVSPRPRIAPEAFAIRLWEPVAADRLRLTLGAHSLNLPNAYRRVLECVNGLHAFQMNPFGVPAASLQNPRMVDRSRPGPFDLLTANSAWLRAYRVDPGWCMIGSGPYSETENAGYFVHTSGVVRGVLKGGTHFAEWGTVSAFVTAELAKAQKRFPEHESYMEKLKMRTNRR